MSEIVKIDCGGTIFKTYASTITTSPFFESYLKRWKDEKRDTIFVDADPKLFKHFLNLLRDINYKIPEHLRENVENMCEYYEVPELKKSFESRPFLCQDIHNMTPLCWDSRSFVGRFQINCHSVLDVNISFKAEDTTVDEVCLEYTTVEERSNKIDITQFVTVKKNNCITYIVLNRKLLEYLTNDITLFIVKVVLSKFSHNHHYEMACTITYDAYS